MGEIEQFYRHEAELLRHMAGMVELIDDYAGADGAFGLELQLNRLVGQWRSMLMWRDRLVYCPAASGPILDSALVALACQAHMSALSVQVEDFARRWSSSALIATAFPQFRTAAVLLIAAIAARLVGEQRLLGALASPMQRVA